MEKRASIATAQIDYNLLAYLSHDVRSPFNGLIGFSDLLSTHFDELSEDKRKEYADLIRQLSRKSFFQLQFFTTWIRLISNNLHVNLTVVQYKDLIHQSIEFCSNDIDSKNITVIEETQPSFRLQADTTLITTAISSVFSSAIRLMDSNSPLTISMVSEKPVHLKISGKFSDAVDPRSDPFQLILLDQNEYTESSSKLWIAKQILDKHNGSLSFAFPTDPSNFEIHISFSDQLDK